MCSRTSPCYRISAAHLVCLLVSCLVLCARSESSATTSIVRGRVLLPATQQQTSSGVKVLLLLDGGKQLTAHCGSDGSFVFHSVPAGSHTLQVYCIHYLFADVRVDISARSGMVTGQWMGDRQRQLQHPFELRPMMKAQYYPERTQFDVQGLWKSPYAWMIGMGFVGIVLLPMIPKPDPEEYEKFNKELQDQGGFFKALIGGGPTAQDNAHEDARKRQRRAGH